MPFLGFCWLEKSAFWWGMNFQTKKNWQKFQTDLVDSAFAIDWMRDFEKFQSALDKDETFMADLTRSLALVLDEFYQNLKVFLSEIVFTKFLWVF